MRHKSDAISRIIPRIEKITETGCWIFTGALHDSGYGIVGVGGRAGGTGRVHRIMYEHFVGAIPDGLIICHKCDVRSCCNPSHLFVGTYKDNSQDCVSKGRNSQPPINTHVVGAAHPLSILNDSVVLSMRSDYDSGMRVMDISRKYGVGYRRVGKVVHRQCWKHIP